MIRLVTPLALALFALSGPTPSDTRAGFVTTLGRDTVAVESFSRTSSRLEGDVVIRVPGTVHFRYELDLRSDGTVSRSMVDRDPLGVPGLSPRRVTLDFVRDSLRATIDSGGHHRRTTTAVDPKAVPFFMTGFGSSFGIYSSLGIMELLVPNTPVSANDTATLASIGVADGAQTMRKLMRRSSTLADIDYFLIAWTHLTTDAQGHILGVDMSETTEKTQSNRTAFFDAESMARMFAERDRAGTGIGAASPNQRLSVALDGSRLFIGYGSPRKRGRDVLGMVIPYDQVWRTGANEATVLLTDRAVTIGNAALPAGSYSLWTLPTRTGVQLIINSQSGQWGTSHDPARDIARVPMQVRLAAAPLEVFTITLAETNNGAELRMAWDTFVWAVPIVVGP